jgi:membrane-bound metal-dependent hydrolase YbcI (DUF457 family)
MGLTDVHSVYGFVLGKLFYEHHPRSDILSVVPSSFPPALAEALKDPRFLSGPVRRANYLIAGVVLANLPDLDVFVALAFRNWSKHRGPSHSIAFLVVSSLCATAPVSYWLRTSRTKAFLFALLCGGSHLLSDYVGNAGLQHFWWPLGERKLALGCVTVLDLSKKKRKTR